MLRLDALFTARPDGCQPGHGLLQGDAGDIHAEPVVFGSAQSGDEAERVRSATHEVPIEGIDGRGVDLDKDFVVFRHGFFDIQEVEDVRWAVAGMEDRFHGAFAFPIFRLVFARARTPVPPSS